MLFVKQFNPYVGIKLGADYAFLAYSDQYSKTLFKKRAILVLIPTYGKRRLVVISIFFRFIPGTEGFSYTPYVSLGVGVFLTIRSLILMVKIFSSPPWHRRAGSSLYPDRKPYSSMAVCFPLTVGVKYAINSDLNVLGK